jgi:YVTN family beta-propeller protein
MLRIRQVLGGILFLAIVGVVSSRHMTTAQPAPSVFANFEGAQTNPIRLSPDGTRLFAVNTPNASVSVFDLTKPGAPALLAQIPVGLEPVSVNPLSDDVAWVVNQVSNSISIISVSRGIVTNTLNLKALSQTATPMAEPVDVVFAGSQAYVSVSRANLIAVFDTQRFNLIATIPVYGDNPRALAVSNDGSQVYAALALSGNATTIIPQNLAPPQPPPTNPSLPPPPQVSLIVAATDPKWSSFVKFKMPDNDVAVIETGATPAVSGYYSGVGTINLGLAVNPVTGDLFVANTDALNLTFFEPELRGHFVTNRVTRIEAGTGTITAFDLNPDIDYGVLPNPGAVATALATPAGMAFDPSGSFFYVAAFGTDRVAKVSTSGQVMSFVEVSLPSGSGSLADPANKRGPRGLALLAQAQTLYCLNRIANTITIINTAQNAVASEIAVGTDPTPAALKQSRGFLYDAKLSGNGTGSCSSCHVDGDMDHLAWNLGDPGGNMTSAEQNGKVILFHPMKGPMTTQTLRGLANLSPYHWRGDKPDFAAFNAAFNSLLGGAELSDADMSAYTYFANSLLFPPNPYLNIDGSMPATLAGGHPATGQTDYLKLHLTSGVDTCNACHTANPGPGTNRLIDTFEIQPIKIPELRNIYQKLLFTRGSPTSIDGFGLDHDGNDAGFQGFFKAGPFKKYTATEKADISAYELCFDTGTAAAVGYTRTLTANNVTNTAVQQDWNTLESQAGLGKIDLIARGTLQRQLHGLLYQPATNNYISDSSTIYTQAQLQTLIQAGSILSMMGVYPGTGTVQ